MKKWNIVMDCSACPHVRYTYDYATELTDLDCVLTNKECSEENCPISAEKHKNELVPRLFMFGHEEEIQ